MTEAEWNSATDPTKMLAHLKGKASDRKLRLFAVACCRRIWHLLGHDFCKEAVVVAELHADGLVDELVIEGRTDESGQAITAMSMLSEGAEAAATAAAWSLGDRTQMSSVCRLASAAMECAHPESFWSTARNDESCLQSELLRDIFGNPFHPATVDPSLLTSTVVALATSIYQERAFERLPILADALEEAGCDDPAILDHLRGENRHVRGCWVVDLVLVKE